MPRVCWEGCLNAGPGAGIGDQIVARLASYVGLQQQCSTSAVWRLAHRRRCVNATRLRHVCIQNTVNLLLCRSNRMLAVHVHTSICMHYPISSVPADHPATLRQSPNIVSLLGQLRTQWTIINTALGRCLLFARQMT